MWENIQQDVERHCHVEDKVEHLMGLVDER